MSYPQAVAVTLSIFRSVTGCDTFQKAVTVPDTFSGKVSPTKRLLL